MRKNLDHHWYEDDVLTKEVRTHYYRTGGEPWSGYKNWYASWLAWHRTLGTQTPAERIECPALLLTSDPQGGAAVTEPEVQAIAAAWHQGQHVSFPQASHFLHHEMQGEQFDHFIAVVDAFLKGSQSRGEPTR